MLTITQLSASLGRTPVLHDITLSACPGELLAICGPNGAGKSTLLRAVLGEIGYRGQIRLNGLDPATTRPATLARHRAVLPQDTSIAFPFTLAEVISMGHEAGDFAARPDIPARALAAVDLAGHARRRLPELSGGERQRAQLARALAQVWEPVGPEGPRWLFLDEPVASLDLGHQLQVMTLARRFADQGGGVVAVMHDLNLSAMFADRMALMVAGALMAQGPPECVLTTENLVTAYGCQIALNTPAAKGPWFVPQSARLPAP